MKTNSIITICLFFSIHCWGQLDSCLSVQKKNGSVLTECFDKTNQIIRSRELIDLDYTRKWDKKESRTTWNENAELTEKFKAKSMIGGDWKQVRKTITWHFRIDGKRCLKRKVMISLRDLK